MGGTTRETHRWMRFWTGEAVTDSPDLSLSLSTHYGAGPGGGSIDHAVPYDADQPYPRARYAHMDQRLIGPDRGTTRETSLPNIDSSNRVGRPRKWLSTSGRTTSSCPIRFPHGQVCSGVSGNTGRHAGVLARLGPLAFPEDVDVSRNPSKEAC